MVAGEKAVRAQEEARRAAMQRENTDTLIETANILVVEDDVDTADFLSALLVEAGFTVEIAPDGPRALDRLESQAPDIVLMDLMLPGMDGYAVIERIRGGTGPGLPIIILTAAGQDSSKLRGFDVGADDFVLKPFSGPELLARIAVQLRRSRELRQLEDQSAFLERALELMSRRQ